MRIHEHNVGLISRQATPRLTSLTQTCGGCPSQWDGTLSDGRCVYIRFRWGRLRVDIDGHTVFGEQISDGLDGVIEEDALKIALKDVLDFSEV